MGSEHFIASDWEANKILEGDAIGMPACHTCATSLGIRSYVDACFAEFLLSSALCCLGLASAR